MRITSSVRRASEPFAICASSDARKVANGTGKPLPANRCASSCSVSRRCSTGYLTVDAMIDATWSYVSSFALARLLLRTKRLGIRSA